MKTLKNTIILLLVLFATVRIEAQRLKLTEGNLAPLKDEKSINVEFTYDNLAVGKYSNEQDYISKKKDEYNKKEPGRGDSWEKTWKSDRKYEFEPKFADLFQEYSEMVISKKPVKYTLIFHTTYTEPGYNIYISRKYAEIDAEVSIVETDNRSHVIAVISIQKAPGRTFGGNDYATGDRIRECYADAGKYLGKFIVKNKK
jgi:hypothetical protein